FLDDLIEDELNRTSGLRIEVEARRLAVKVAGRGAEAAMAVIEVHDRHDPIRALGQLGERLWEGQRVVADSESFSGLPTPHVAGQHRLGTEPVGAGGRPADFALGEKDKDATRKIFRVSLAIKRDLKLQRRRVHRYGGQEDNN